MPVHLLNNRRNRVYRFSLERHIRQNIGKFPLVYQMVCLPQVSKSYFKSHRLDVVMEERFTILKEDLANNTALFDKLDQALREVCHWNRDPFDQRTMLEVRNLFETDINLDEDGESEIEKELAFNRTLRRNSGRVGPGRIQHLRGLRLKLSREGDGVPQPQAHDNHHQPEAGRTQEPARPGPRPYL